MIDAFKAYRKTDAQSAVRCVKVAIQRYCAKGNFRRAASQQEALAEVYEQELNDPKSALEACESAASWYEGDNATAYVFHVFFAPFEYLRAPLWLISFLNSLANKLWIKVADMAALEGDYYKAIENYEKVAAVSINNNLMKYSVKEYFLKAGICHLASGDMVATNRALEKYREMDPSFATQREHLLLVDLSEAVEAKSQEQFSDKLYQYDQMSKLDKWKLSMLVKVKDSIQEADDEFA